MARRTYEFAEDVWSLSSRHSSADITGWLDPFLAVILQFGTMPPRFSTLSKGSKQVGVEFCSVSIESGGKNENVAVLLHLVNFAYVCVPFSSDAAA